MGSSRIATAQPLLRPTASCTDRSTAAIPDASATTTPVIDTAAGCPDEHPGDWQPGPDGFTDYVDAVRLGGRQYDQTSATTLSADDLGELVGRVCFTLGDMTFDGAAPAQDGDATFLPVGTELRAIPGANPDLRVAAVTGSDVTMYEVTWVEGAEVGAELIDLGPAITEIWVNSDDDGERIEPITDPAIVGELVEQLATASVDLTPRPESDRDGKRYMIELVRSDGTSSIRSYWIDTGELWPGIDLPPNWRTAVEAALAESTASPP